MRKNIFAGVAIALAIVASVFAADPLLDLRVELAKMNERIAGNEKQNQQRFEAQEKAVAAALAAVKEATAAALAATKEANEKTAAAAEKRLEGVNEFRAQLKDQQVTFIPRIEVDQRIASLTSRINDIKAVQDKQQGEGTGASNFYAYLLGGIGVLIALYTLYLQSHNRRSTNNE